ncbi:VWA domain-containing protein [Candidatus Saccharibacteria bacterium oral taxon 488]|nr:VWA domain-containing protein [Candidatus Saccharibacteria bacterium oral taxon 488]
MTETLQIPASDIEPPELTPEQEALVEEFRVALDDAEKFLLDQKPAICRLTGLEVRAVIGKGWATYPETGLVTIDPLFFIEKGYSANHCVFAILHELMSHVRDIKRDPVFAARQHAFIMSGKDPQEQQARSIFNNILTDIHGNKQIMNMLPAMREVGADLYDNRLFPTERDGEIIDYTNIPMHLQFLYKIIRQEMIPGSETPVRQEVDEAIDQLRNFQSGQVDLISFLTDPGARGSNGKKLSGSDRFDYWLTQIWPKYEALMKLDKQEAKDAQQQNNNQQTNSNTTEQQDTDPSQNDNTKQDSNPFADAYADYFDNKHPEPFSPEEHEKIHNAIDKAAQEKRHETMTPEQRERARQIAADRRYQEQTGHSLHKKQHYDNEVKRLHGQIDQMRQVFRSVLNEVVTTRRGLGHRAHQDGDILDPNRLVQTITDIKSGIAPEAFQRYETVRGRAELNCKTDYFFVFDCSGSMGGAPAKAAASCAVIMLEGLAGMERDIRQLEEQQSIDLSDLSIRTSLYTFGSNATCHKPLGSSLSDKQRLDTYAAVTAADAGGTADYLALQEITHLPHDHDRQRIIVVVTDGASNNPDATQAAISQLRRDQNTVVYGVSIGSDAAEQLYAPNAKLINDPKDLPNVLQSFIETTIQT